MLAFLALAAGPSAAAAQQPRAAVPRLEAAIGLAWVGATHIGDDSAALRARGGGEYVLFRSDSRFAPAAGVEARLGFALTRRVTAEARVALARPKLRTSLSGDVEGAPPIVVAERVERYAIDGALLVAIERLRVGALRPFVSAGAGYVRQLHEGRTVIDNGVAVHAGGGVRHVLFAAPGGFLSGGGVRADARVSVVSSAIGQGSGPRPQAAVSGSFFVTF